MTRHIYRPTAGDIGEPVKHVEFEPFPETAPAEPIMTPVHEPELEPVPA